MNYSQEDLVANRIPFIHSFSIEPDVCRGLVDFYNESHEKEPGVTSQGDGRIVIDKTVKDSLDVSVTVSENDPRICLYREKLFSGLDGFKTRYPALDENLWYWGVTESFSIQRYEPGGGFFGWHCERGQPGSRFRVLVFMTYLNDVSDGGHTEWKYLGLKVQPRLGLTVVWPTDWMYLHRGITSPTERKMIVTGWFSFYPNDN